MQKLGLISKMCIPCVFYQGVYHESRQSAFVTEALDWFSQKAVKSAKGDHLSLT